MLALYSVHCNVLNIHRRGTVSSLGTKALTDLIRLASSFEENEQREKGRKSVENEIKESVLSAKAHPIKGKRSHCDSGPK